MYYIIYIIVNSICFFVLRNFSASSMQSQIIRKLKPTNRPRRPPKSAMRDWKE